MEVYDLLQLLVAQTAPEQITVPKASDGLANVLLWALVAVCGALSTVSGFMFKAYAKARDGERKALEAQIQDKGNQITAMKVAEKENLTVMTKLAEASTTLNNTMGNVLQALQGIDRRLEDVDRKID